MPRGIRPTYGRLKNPDGSERTIMGSDYVESKLNTKEVGVETTQWADGRVEIEVFKLNDYRKFEKGDRLASIKISPAGVVEVEQTQVNPNEPG